MIDWKEIARKLAKCLSFHEHDHLAGEPIQWDDHDDEVLSEYRSASDFESKDNSNVKTRVNKTFLNGFEQWQVEGQGCYGLWFPMGHNVVFDTEEEAEYARLDPDSRIYNKQ